MTRRLGYPAWLLPALLVTVGCARQPTAPVNTGAEDAARAYFEALVRRDWPAAYQTLDAESRARCSRERFSRLAENYRRNLGFEPAEVRVQGCDERGGEAVAHVVLRGPAGSEAHFYKDGVGLRRGEGGWAVVLPQTFGAPRRGRGVSPAGG